MTVPTNDLTRRLKDKLKARPKKKYGPDGRRTDEDKEWGRQFAALISAIAAEKRAETLVDNNPRLVRYIGTERAYQDAVRSGAILSHSRTRGRARQSTAA